MQHYGRLYDVQHIFRRVLFHEARHAWQYTLLIRSGSPYTNSEPLGGLMFPDNDDDRDLLPEQAFLKDKTTDLGGPDGSASGLLDVNQNPDAPGVLNDWHSDRCTYKQNGNSPYPACELAAERDAERFANALDFAVPAINRRRD